MRVYTDWDGHICRLDPEALRLLGVTERAATNRNVVTFFSADRSRVLEHLHAAAGGFAYSFVASIGLRRTNVHGQIKRAGASILEWHLTPEGSEKAP